MNNQTVTEAVVEDGLVEDSQYFVIRFIRLLPKVFFLCFILFFILSFLSRFFYIDISSGCYITFLPSWDFQFNTPKIKEGLTVLKYGAPEHYAKVCGQISLIDPNFDCAGDEGGCYWPGDPTKITVSTSSTGAGWIASVIAHETCHAFQDLEKRDFNEAECHALGGDVLVLVSKY